jgi:hypothetical protein
MAATPRALEAGLPIGPAERALLKELRRALMTVATAIDKYLADCNT